MNKCEILTEKINTQAGDVILDWSAFSAACLNKPELMAKLLDLFVQQTPLWLDKFQRAVRDQNYQEIRKICHTVKGATAAMHTVSCAASVERIHALSQSEEKSWEMVQNALDDLVQVFKETRDACVLLTDSLDQL